jgi:hypothetical protein
MVTPTNVLTELRALSAARVDCWRRWAIELVGATPAARAASDEDLRRAVAVRHDATRRRAEVAELRELRTRAALDELSALVKEGDLVAVRNLLEVLRA